MKESKSFRTHIGIFGRRNTGKSSLLNALVRQNVSIVSDYAGTTTDPVEKPMEFLPLGPVLFIDTAGIDDTGEVGNLRTAKTCQVFERTDLALLVAEAGKWGEYEQLLVNEFIKREIPHVVIFNKCDLLKNGGEKVQENIEQQLSVQGIQSCRTVALISEGLKELRQKILASCPAEFFKDPDFFRDLVEEGDTIVLVTPIDKEAPKGRLILPQVQAIRNLLDHNCCCVVVKENELKAALDNLKSRPKLVVTDSQAFLEVSAVTPDEVMMTSFSILLARIQGDLTELIRGAIGIDSLEPGDRILVAEACSHHPIVDDIGRVKIPKWLTKHVGGNLDWTVTQGHDFPSDIGSYKLVIHCGACMSNRKEMMSRIMYCKEQNVLITNYGLAIAYTLGLFERALSPFPHLQELYRGTR